MHDEAIGPALAAISDEGSRILAAVTADLAIASEAAMREVRRRTPKSDVAGLIALMRQARQAMLGAARRQIMNETAGRQAALVRSKRSRPQRSHGHSPAPLR